MASLRPERAAGGPRLPMTRAGGPVALRLLLLLLGGSVAHITATESSSLKSPTALLKPQESLAQSLPTPDSLEFEGSTVEVNYESMVVYCWNRYKNQMDTIEKDWCNWAVISRPYSDLQECLEHSAEVFSLGFPNPLAERVILDTHQIHFANCSLVQPTFSDPPEDVLLAMIIAPICLIPFLVTLVVWKSKDSEAQA
ncbi:receptor activity-modifying protein 2 [Ochotona princeps]|uniref:receptor activity-modifying protein 2 n=1 Tax=Ochotona princeps TaxID=9978 RepID=UPI00271496A1|nr:receptor activity-modifying protein 2 [Ochotona princeps]